MPQRRTKRRNKAPTRSRNGGGYLDTAAKALAVAYAVKKLINVEFHTLNTFLPVDPNTTGATKNMTAIAQGDDIANRQGDKIRLKYLSLSGTIKLHASATTSQVRLVLVRDNNGSTTQPAISDIWVSAAFFLDNKHKTGAPQVNSRFTILYDKFFLINSVGNNQVAFNWSSSLDHHCYFTGTQGTDEGKGHIYCMIASNEATNDPIVTADIMVKWIDN